MARKFIRALRRPCRIPPARLSPSSTRSVSKNGLAAPTWIARAAPALGPERPVKQMDALGDLLQALRAVVAGIHGRHAGQQRLGRADVAGGLLAANVLLAGLQRKPQGRAAARILGDADDAAWHMAFESVARGEDRPRAARRSPAACRTAARCRAPCPRRIRPAAGAAVRLSRSAATATSAPAACACSMKPE